MYRLVVLCTLLVAALADPIPPAHGLRGRIIGGRNASIEDVPYQVLIQFMEHTLCSASIISEDVVITVAHCIQSDAVEYMTIRAGSANATEGGSIHRIKSFYKHENFTENHYRMLLDDIALVKVTPPFKLDETRQPIPLFAADAESKPGTLAFVSGWGYMKPNGQPSNTLQIVTLRIMSKALCSLSYYMMGGLPSGQICTSPKRGVDACQADSGGPLVINGALAGIVSWGVGCAAGKPGVYTEIASYRNWIDSSLTKLNEGETN